MTQHKFDTIIVGLGAMGSAALYQLSKRGNRVLGIDQYSPPHIYGSSHGDTRMIREAIGEGEEYIPLVRRSYALIRELEEYSHAPLLAVTGALILESQHTQASPHNRFEFLQTTIRVAEKYHIIHELLNTAEIKKRFPQFHVTDEIGYYEPGAGYLSPENCIGVQLNLAELQGASVKRNEQVLEVIPAKGRVTVKTDKGTYHASKLILAAGPWICRLLGASYRKHFAVHRQVMYWFSLEHAQRFQAPAFPAFVWIFDKGGEYGFYGFPSTDGRTMKLAREELEAPVDPDTLERTVSQEEIASMYEQFVHKHLPQVSATCTTTETCMYTSTPDAKFVIDVHPEHPEIIIASPCSGHGFKYSAAIGEVLAELAIDTESSIDISNFSIKRFG